jgi:phosphoribosylformylglycinamidine synthase
LLKELVEPAGADIFLDGFEKGDPSLSALEVWGAEYQESVAIVAKDGRSLDLIRAVCAREGVTMSEVGIVKEDGRITLHSSRDDSKAKRASPLVDLPLEPLLGRRPQRAYRVSRPEPVQSSPRESIRNADRIPLRDAVRQTLRILSVGSKAFLTTKVDRSVTGLVAQQPCVGPWHVPVADVGESEPARQALCSSRKWVTNPLCWRQASWH